MIHPLKASGIHGISFGSLKKGIISFIFFHVQYSTRIFDSGYESTKIWQGNLMMMQNPKPRFDPNCIQFSKDKKNGIVVKMAYSAKTPYSTGQRSFNHLSNIVDFTFLIPLLYCKNYNYERRSFSNTLFLWMRTPKEMTCLRKLLLTLSSTINSYSK